MTDKNTGNIDSLEDRLWLAANLVSLEEHAYSSYLRTSDRTYIQMMEFYREQRIAVFKGILGDGAQMRGAELWCMFKHTLGAAMRAYESGNRDTRANPDLAASYFDMSKKMAEQALKIIEMANLPDKDGPENCEIHMAGEPPEGAAPDGQHPGDAAPSDRPAAGEKKGFLYYLKCCLE